MAGKRVRVFLALIGLVGVSPIRAQTKIVFNVSKDNAGTKVAAPDLKDAKAQQPIVPNVALVADVNCTAGVNCNDIKARLVSKEDTTGVAASVHNASQAHVNLELEPKAWEGRTDLKLELFEGGKSIIKLGLGLLSNATVAQQGAGPNPFPASLNALLTVDCSALVRRVATAYENISYVPSENVARFVVTANGNVALRPPPVLDENDRIDVYVVGPTPLLPALKVRRTSEFRTPGVLNIVGGNDNLPDLGTRKATQDGAPTCDVLQTSLGDFQPGRGEVTISAITANGDQNTGSFEFGVNTLYSGAFALGATESWLRDPSFALVARGKDSVITAIADRTPRTLYVLTYTPFVWGKRDLEKPERDLLSVRRVNPMFGIVLNDIRNNFIAGATYDLMSTVYLSGGVHLGRVHVLNPDARVATGEVFVGNSAQVPVATEWHAGGFVGISLDLRAATQFFSKALGSAAAK